MLRRCIEMGEYQQCVTYWTQCGPILKYNFCLFGLFDCHSDGSRYFSVQRALGFVQERGGGMRGGDQGIGGAAKDWYH